MNLVAVFGLSLSSVHRLFGLMTLRMDLINPLTPSLGKLPSIGAAKMNWNGQYKTLLISLMMDIIRRGEVGRHSPLLNKALQRTSR